MRRHSEETKRKIAEWHKGKVVSEETRKRLSIAKKGKTTKWKGQKHTEETKRKIGEKSKGRVLSAEARKKISDAQTGEKNWNWKGGLKKDRKHINRLHQLTKYKRKAQMSGGSFTLKDWEEIKERYGFMCPACSREEPEIKLTIDHIIPLSKGGLHDKSNIQPLCKNCNSSKNVKLISYINKLEVEDKQWH